MRIEFSPLALRDLEGIGDYIAEDNPPRALSFVTELHAQCTTIAKAPRIYPARPELANGLRSCAHGNYVIFFSVTKSVLRIQRILHGTRDLSTQFNKPR